MPASMLSKACGSRCRAGMQRASRRCMLALRACKVAMHAPPPHWLGFHFRIEQRVRPRSLLPAAAALSAEHLVLGGERAQHLWGAWCGAPQVVRALAYVSCSCMSLLGPGPCLPRARPPRWQI